jgi:hypothetical protein
LNSPYSLLTSAMIAGVPAAALVTPGKFFEVKNNIKYFS